MAQGNQLSGYYVNIKGDSVSCLFSKNDFREISESLTIKQTGDRKQMVLNPNNCLGFGIKGSKEYRTIRTKLNYTSTGSQMSKWDVSEETLVFMEVLEDNPLALYSYKINEKDDVFFVGKVKGLATQLINHSYYQSNGQLVENEYFRNQIYQLTIDRIIPINGLKYDAYSLKKYIAKYNNLNDSLGRSVKFRVGLGANYNFVHKVSSYSSLAEFDANVSPSLEVDLNAPLSAKTGEDFIKAGLNFNAIKLKRQDAATIFTRLQSFSAYNLFGFIGYRKGFKVSDNINLYTSLNFGPNSSFGGKTISSNGEQIKMEEGDTQSGDFKLRKTSMRCFASSGLDIGDKIELELRFDRIQRYNFKSDNGGKSSLNFLGLFMFYKLN
ncbi:hypothetical protein [uncultured Arcticibacterium sp.]|uniref:hypothetical protein n=1 Tax=uncultured Arcticibacterium sp. TaxID=2173042 RepID=UPI0030FC29B3